MGAPRRLPNAGTVRRERSRIWSEPSSTRQAPRRGRPPPAQSPLLTQVIAVRVPGDLRGRLDAYLARLRPHNRMCP